MKDTSFCTAKMGSSSWMLTDGDALVFTLFWYISGLVYLRWPSICLRALRKHARLFRRPSPHRLQEGDAVTAEHHIPLEPGTRVLGLTRFASAQTSAARSTLACTLTHPVPRGLHGQSCSQANRLRRWCLNQSSLRMDSSIFSGT